MIQEVKITKREQQVLELISLEYTSDEIAQEMFISTHTSHTHRKNLLYKLEAKNTAGLVRKAFECRLLHLSCVVCFLILNSVQTMAQDPMVDVEGDIKIRGVIDINHPEDTTSVYIGRNTYSSLLNSSDGQNTFVGSNAGSRNDEEENSFFGASAGYNNVDGYGNSFFGAYSGRDNVDGYSNSFFGVFSGVNNVGGQNNSFFGQSSGRNNVDGDYNSFFGTTSGYNNVDGSSNSFFGRFSGLYNVGGFNNSFFGESSGLSNVGGDHNSFFGESAGYYNELGSYNTFIGVDSGIESSATPDSLDRAIAIGYNAIVKCHNCAVIGGTGEDAVNVGIGTKSPNARLHIKSDSDLVSESLLL
ncbi:MAG: helix-turn-helix transcriptional regulator [Saprospiraceae bacterium]|nr:helix-turn-helix transcriptional regulator [Saprospiraceae bacterium]